MAPDATLIAQAWVAYWKEHEATGEFPESEASGVVSDLTRENPSLAFRVILEILRGIEARPDSELFQVLAAGPVEDLLGHHGDTIIDVVEGEASQNEAFKLLLGGVWKGRMSPTVWGRVQACRSGEW